MRSSDKALKQAISAERQAIAIYEAELPILRWRGVREISVYSEILNEERQHEGVLEQALGNIKISGFFSLDHVAGTIFGWFLGILPLSWNFYIHAWAEREAAKSYWIARSALLSSSHEAGILAKKLGIMARQELSHRKRFLKLMKGMSHE